VSVTSRPHELDDAVPVAVWKRRKKEVVDGAKDVAIRGDSNSEREHRDASKERGTTDLTHCKSQILQQAHSELT
jgi:hypothetical protein